MPEAVKNELDSDRKITKAFCTMWEKENLTLKKHHVSPVLFREVELKSEAVERGQDDPLQRKIFMRPGPYWNPHV